MFTAAVYYTEISDPNCPIRKDYSTKKVIKKGKGRKKHFVLKISDHCAKKPFANNRLTDEFQRR